MSTESCRYCGAYHGVRCPAVAAIEYHTDGTVRRVEFVQPKWSPAQLGPQMPAQTPVQGQLPSWVYDRLGYPPAQTTISMVGPADDWRFALMNQGH